jgi:hypothetical protein
MSTTTTTTTNTTTTTPSVLERMSLPLPEGWEVRIDASLNKPYFIDHNTKQTHWTLPVSLLPGTTTSLSSSSSSSPPSPSSSSSPAVESVAVDDTTSSSSNSTSGAMYSSNQSLVSTASTLSSMQSMTSTTSSISTSFSTEYEARHDATTGRWYYVDHIHQTTTWECPTTTSRLNHTMTHREIPDTTTIVSSSPASPSPSTTVPLIAAQSPVNESLLSPESLPFGWEYKETADGRIYYVDHVNERTQWEHPNTAMLSTSAAVTHSNRSTNTAAANESLPPTPYATMMMCTAMPVEMNTAGEVLATADQGQTVHAPPTIPISTQPSISNDTMSNNDVICSVQLSLASSTVQDVPIPHATSHARMEDQTTSRVNRTCNTSSQSTMQLPTAIDSTRTPSVEMVNTARTINPAPISGSSPFATTIPSPAEPQMSSPVSTLPNTFDRPPNDMKPTSLLPIGWVCKTDDHNEAYYVNNITRETQRTLPTGQVPSSSMASTDVQQMKLLQTLCLFVTGCVIL